MTETDHAEVSNDLAYVRAIAEEGRNAPLTGGIMFVWWGSVIAFGALMQFFADIDLIDMPFNSLIRWSAIIALGWIGGYLVFEKKIGKIPGGSTFGNKTAAAAWSAVGLFITIYWLSLTAAMFLPKGENAFPIGYLFGTMFPVAFGLFGVTFFVTAVAMNQDWMKRVAVLSWGFMVILILMLSFNPILYSLVSAIGCILIVVLPGLKMMKDQPSDIV